MSQARTLKELASDDYQKTEVRITRRELYKNLHKIIVDAFAVESATKYKLDTEDDDFFMEINYNKALANVPVSNSAESQKNSAQFVFNF